MKSRLCAEDVATLSIRLGKVADARVYSGQVADTIVNPELSIVSDRAYAAEKARRMQLITRAQ